jgi:hypothetical protein
MISHNSKETINQSIKNEKNTYMIIRFKSEGKNRIIARGLTLEQAQAHCKDPETSSRTANNKRNIKGEWFDGYDLENN